MPSATGAAARHLLLPQEAAFRRLGARVRAGQPTGAQAKATLEEQFGPDGLAYYEAALGDIVLGGLGIFGGAVVAGVTGHGTPEAAGLWLMAAGVISALIGLGRVLQAIRSGRAFRRRAHPD
jgi:hypothetical protein